ncbi:MAG: sensor histidine kinase [Chloroflexi bacterium]|nr:sensor histidine kinase [Chloroflexota bacterium]
MERRSTLEPGLLSLFRMLTAFRVGLVMLGALGIQRHSGAWSTLLLGLADGSVLLVYLAWPGLPRRLGRLYLPLGLGIAVVGPLLTQHALAPFSEIWTVAPLLMAWQQLPVLLIPVVLIAWQYGFRAALIVIIGTPLLDLGLAFLFGGSSGIMSLFPAEASLDLARGLAVALFSRTITLLVAGYMVSRLVMAQRQQRAALAQANARLVGYAATLEQLTTSRERNRLARELHDTLAHSLSAMAVQLEAADALWDTAPDEARRRLARSLDTTRDGLAETRRALQALRASPLDDLGLGLAVRALGESVAARNRLAVDVQAPETIERLSPAVEQCVYRVAQEALENVTRHAVARRVSVGLDVQGQRVVLTVADDGQGFDVAAALADDRFGVRGMQERAEMVGGALEVTSAPGQGTMVRLTVEDTA